MRQQNRTCDRCDISERPRDSYDSRERSSQQEESQWREGVLPPCAPLANPYVPFQRNNPPTYEPRHGVVRGTLFPGLDLPYRGMVNEGTLGRTHLQELQTLSFAITELGEYLDTHSDDKDAFALFRNYVRLYKEGRERYEMLHGPLSPKDVAEQDCYNWLKDPWPWDYEANKEG